MKFCSFILGIVGVALIATLAYSNLKKGMELKSTNSELVNLKKYSHNVDSINKLYLDSLKNSKILADNLELQIDGLKHEVIVLDNKLQNVLDSIDNEVPYDSSYSYLQKKYPYGGEKSYPFNGPQVKQFHKLSVKDLWDSIKITRLDLQIVKYDSLIKAKDLQIVYLDTIYNSTKKVKDYYEDYSDKINKELINTNNKLNKVKLTRDISLGGLVVLLIVTIF